MMTPAEAHTRANSGLTMDEVRMAIATLSRLESDDLDVLGCHDEHGCWVTIADASGRGVMSLVRLGGRISVLDLRRQFDFSIHETVTDAAGAILMRMGTSRSMTVQ